MGHHQFRVKKFCLLVLVLWVGCGLIFPTVQANEDQEVEPAKLKVKGYGLLGNRELKNLLQILETPGEERPFFDANFVEDAVLVIFSRLHRDGYLNPNVRVRLTLADGSEQEFTWTQPILPEPLPRPMEVKRLEIYIEEGVLFYFKFLGFHGINAITVDEAAHFFIETDALIRLKKSRIYSPERLTRGLHNLEDALARLGYQSATVTATNLIIQTNSGAVRVDIVVDEGPKSIVRSIQQEIHPAQTNAPIITNLISTNIAFSPIWLQDYIQQVRRTQYRQGFADTTVDVIQNAQDPGPTNVYLHLQTIVRPGREIRVGEVRFQGNEETKESVLHRRVRVSAGDLLNPIRVEQGRFRLARLGIFDSVELTYENVDERTRDVIFTVDEGKEISFSLLAGWGSYEMLRAGFELEQNNLWGLAHHQRLKAIQSFKATHADYTYTMPELLGQDFDVFANASALIREEPSFTREEFGGGAGVRRLFRPISTDVSLLYNYQVLNTTDLDIPPTEGLKQANVGAFVLDIRHDRRDNPLTPRTGYKFFTNLEIASDALAGDVSYQRLETSASYHHQLGRSQWIHLGVSHGFVTTDRGPSEDLPINKRFFPGGDNSIRGFQYGEASPRNAEGDVVGAESYLLGNIEFEQGLTRTWSVVIFFDALGTARRLDHYPFNEGLYSVGGGLRWRTIIGPARLEYGHNLNPRHEDPSGTVHFSIGFPF